VSSARARRTVMRLVRIAFGWGTENVPLNRAGGALHPSDPASTKSLCANCALTRYKGWEAALRYEKGVLKLPEMGSEGMMDQAETRLKSTPMPGNLITQALARATPMLQSLSEGFEVGFPSAPICTSTFTASSARCSTAPFTSLWV
jgi:hypothetical protein